MKYGYLLFLIFIFNGCLSTQSKNSKRLSLNFLKKNSAKSNLKPISPMTRLVAEENTKKEAFDSSAQSFSSMQIQIKELENNLRHLRGQVEVLTKNQADQDLNIQVLSDHLKNLSQTKKEEIKETHISNASKKPKEISDKKLEKTNQLEKDPFKVAEKFFKESQWKQAIVYYEQYREKNKKGRWYKKATFQIGQCFKNLKMEIESRVFFQEVVNLFPKSSEATKARQLLSKKK